MSRFPNVKKHVEITDLRDGSEMLDTTLITDVEVEDIDNRDYPDFCDAFISSAVWKDTGKNLTDEELDELNDNHRDFVYEMVWEYLH